MNEKRSIIFLVESGIEHNMIKCLFNLRFIVGICSRGIYHIKLESLI